ncbi:efflux RND transporter periplasmic adaptor subunit [Patescibacteria group bacterium]|nr:efflux RND transporter periplasmic adaptor subunit [Patescibacteria group bacterium]MBU4162086.1 efflux RND transporter periplasmic adaptor subunit [Patescibacteria group bacterium]
MKIRLKKKTIIILSIIAILIVAVIIIFASRNGNTYDFYTVTKGDVVQEISESGIVKKGDIIPLSFKSIGQIEKIFIKAGDEVSRGTVLAKLNSAQLYIQLQQAKANLALAQAELAKLTAGASVDEVRVAETTVDNAKTTLENEEKDLDNAVLSADNNLKETYDDAFDTLNDSYLKAYNALTTVTSIQGEYFSDTYQYSLEVKAHKDSIQKAQAEMKIFLDEAKLNFTESNIDSALVNFEKNLTYIRDDLTGIRIIIESENYRKTVSSTDKTSLDTQRGYINTAYTNITGDQQSISSAKITNKTNIDIAEASVASAKDALKVAENNLTLVTAGPRSEDINLYQAKLRSAQASVDILENQIYDTNLRSPVDGIVVSVDKLAGETVQATIPIISVLPSEEFEIEVDVYEEDVVKIEENDLVKISLVAFPKEAFEGRVIFIEPTEKLIDGVVYYEVRINFDSVPDGLKQGMTADVLIIIDSRENILVVSEDAVQKDGDRAMVEIMENGKIKEKEIQIGLEGDNDLIEVIEGLREGEQVIIQ